jgi:hypothetical protein
MRGKNIELEVPTPEASYYVHTTSRVTPKPNELVDYLRGDLLSRKV